MKSIDNTELLQIIARDEDSSHQFKADVTNELSIAQEMIAFSNTIGGMLLIGVSDDGSISGLTRVDINRINNLISNAASQQIKPSINPLTRNYSFAEGLVMAVHIQPGLSKPYMDRNGVIWVKNGADKREATSREEIQRMYQSSRLLHGDEVLVPRMTADNIDEKVFSAFYRKQFGEEFQEQDLPLHQIIENMDLSRNGTLNIAGALLFGKNTVYRLPVFIVKCVHYPGIEISDDNYIDSEDYSGTIKDMFDGSLKYILRNIRRVQNGQGVNSLGELEIPKIVFEELITNAIIHRDYFVSSPIRIMVFSNRFEIINPGHLPNNLTISNIKSGNSNIRNPILTSFATRILPYRGLGTGIRRALKAYSNIEFVNDRDNNIFKAVVHYPQIAEF